MRIQIAAHRSPPKRVRFSGCGWSQRICTLDKLTGAAGAGPQTILGAARSRVQVRERLEQKGTPQDGEGANTKERGGETVTIGIYSDG